MQADTHTSGSPEGPLPPLAFIGGGNMAHAIVSGAADAGVLDPSRVVVADPSPDRRALFAHAASTASEALSWLVEKESEAGRGQVVLAVKPQVFPRVAEEIGALVGSGPGRVVLSIMAGTSSAAIRDAFGGGCRVVRTMPNTPCQIRRGVSAIALGAGARPGDEAVVRSLLGAVGRTVDLGEDMIDAFTGLAGSGPAYVFYLAEALASAGERVGFGAGEARAIAEAVVTGSAALLGSDGRPAVDLRRAVTSPNGTTQAGTETLDRLGVAAAFGDAVVAARDRGRELAGG